MTSTAPYYPSRSRQSLDRKPKPPARQQFMAVLLMLYLIQFTGAWIYPPSSAITLDSLQLEKFMGVPFQYAIWGLVVLTLAWHGQTYGLARLSRVLAVVAPFGVVGLVSAVFGFNPFTSTRYVILWSLAVIGAAVVGSELAPQCGLRILCQMMLLLMAGSVVMALAVPSIGQQGYGFTMVWRGLFTGKNQLGWIAALALIIATSYASRTTWKLSASTILMAGVCLVFSGSKGALAAAMVAIGYIYLVNWLAPRVTPGFGVFVTLSMMAIAGLTIFLVLPYVLEALGRDMTLTGRTDVWRTYFAAMTKTLWLGEGAGAYTSLSPLTLPLAAKLTDLGAIVTPHNIFLGVLGDAGLFGLLAFIAMQVYLTLTRPFLVRQPSVILCSGIGFVMMAHGMVETHEVLSPGPGWMLLMLTFAFSLQEQHGPLQPLQHVGRRVVDAPEVAALRSDSNK